MIYSVSILFEC